MSTISFDWDKTLFDDELNSFKQCSLMLLKRFLDDGDRVIITTSRTRKWIPEVIEALKSENLTLDVFSAPNVPFASGEEGLSKSDILVREKAFMHFDDIPGHSDLEIAIKMGVKVLLT